MLRTLYNNEVTLISKTYEFDEFYNQVPYESRRKILCSENTVTRYEFYIASEQGLNPSLSLFIHPYEYNNEDELEYNGNRYSIIRTFQKDFENLELVCEVKANERRN